EDGVAGTHDDVLKEWIGDLYRALIHLRFLSVEHKRCKGRAAKTGRVGGFADEHEIVSLASLGNATVDDTLALHEAKRDDIDQAIVTKRRMEIHIAGQIGHADGVAIGCNTVDCAGSNICRVRADRGRTKAKRIRTCDDFG